MSDDQKPQDRTRILKRRLQELDDSLRARREELQVLRALLRALQAERRAVAEELAGVRAAMVDAVRQRLEGGMSVRDIARAIDQSPAAVSRVVEKIKAEGRKRSRQRP